MDNRVQVFSYFKKTKSFVFIPINGIEYTKKTVYGVRKWTTVNGKFYLLLRVVYSRKEVELKVKQSMDVVTQFVRGPDLYHVWEVTNENQLKNELLCIWYTPYLGGAFEICFINNGDHRITNELPEMTEIVKLIWEMIGIEAKDIKKEEELMNNLFDYKIE